MRIIIGLMIVLIGEGAMAQKHDYVWKSGHHSTLTGVYNGGYDINFNNNPPDTTYVFRDIDFLNNSASICDKQGNHLFSSNGCVITGHDDLILMHGDSLNPGYYFNEFCDTSVTAGYPTLQDIFFLPHLTDTNQYYLIHIGAGYANYIPSSINKHIYYTLVDKTLDGGHGDVVEKNVVVLEDTMSLSSLSAVRHGNGEDWWIVTTEFATDKYIFLRLTADSFYESHRQLIGDLYQEDGQNGQNNFSPDGNWFARFGRDNGLALYRFNRCEGSLHEPLYDVTPSAPPDSLTGSGGVAFSEDSRMLYMVTNLWIYQYDLWADDIIGSKIRVATWDGTLIPPSNVGGFFNLPQLAPDGRIFISSINSIPYFHVIEKPNERGVACEVNQLGFPVPRRNGFVTPYFPNYRLGALGPGGCDSLPTSTREMLVLENYGMSIYPNPATDEVRVHFQKSILHGDELVVYDLYGREMFRQPAEWTRIDIANLPKGVYVLQWKRGEDVLSTSKLIKS